MTVDNETRWRALHSATFGGEMRACHRQAFTLIELLVALAIIGVLVGLLLPAVQAAREQARQTACLDNLRNMGVALNNYNSARGSFPAGCDQLTGTQQAWSSRILPFLEAGPLARQIDYSLAWNAAGANLFASQQNLPVYVCPSSLTSCAGKQDYAGVTGTTLMPLAPNYGPQGAYGCGTLIMTSAEQTAGIKASMITDGLSTTLCVAESADREDLGTGGLWACGLNCICQNQPFVNTDDLDSLHSSHPTGAFGLFADGHARLLTDDIEAAVLGAICTRNGNEANPMASVAD